MSGHWEFYICPVDDYQASIALDMGLAEELPMANMDWLVAVSVELKQPAEGGFTTQEEYPILCTMEDRLVEAVKNKIKGIQVGRVTGGGLRDYLFYVPTTSGVSQAIEEAMSEFDYNYKVNQQEEVKWETYWEFLYPNPWQINMIENRHLVEHLVSQGDDSEQVRPVDHYAYLPTEEKAKILADDVAGWGEDWKVEGITFKEEDETWQIHAICQQKTDLITVNQRSGRLFEEAYHLAGQYDGWGTVICKSE